MFYFGFFGWIVVIAATVWLNYFRIEKRKVKPTYLNSNWSRAIFGFACLVLMTVESGFDPAYLRTWGYVWIEVVYIVSAWGFFFDPALNIARKKPIDYQGKNSGWFDKSPKWLYYGMKIICLAGFIYSFIILIT